MLKGNKAAVLDAVAAAMGGHVDTEGLASALEEQSEVGGGESSTTAAARTPVVAATGAHAASADTAMSKTDASSSTRADPSEPAISGLVSSALAPELLSPSPSTTKGSRKGVASSPPTTPALRLGKRERKRPTSRLEVRPSIGGGGLLYAWIISSCLAPSFPLIVVLQELQAAEKATAMNSASRAKGRSRASKVKPPVGRPHTHTRAHTHTHTHTAYHVDWFAPSPLPPVTTFVPRVLEPMLLQLPSLACVRTRLGDIYIRKSDDESQNVSGSCNARVHSACAPAAPTGQ